MMKGHALLFSLLFLAAGLKAQLWLEIGGKANYGLTGYYNKNIINDRQHDFSLNGGLAYGGVIGLNIGDYHGFNIEGLKATSQQKLSYRDLLADIDNVLQWETFDLYFLYRYYSESGAYFEIGPKLSKVKLVEQTLEKSLSDVKDLYEDQDLSAALGLGGFLAGTDIFTLKLGIRLEYAFQDFVNEAGMDSGHPAPYTSYSSYTPTHPVRATIGIELNFGVGGVAQASCGRRRLMFGTRYR